MKMKYPINLHKGLTLIVVLGMMFWYDNFTLGPWVYLALHGSYGLLWLLKDQVYPDKRWEEEMPITMAAAVFLSLAAYWVAPFLLISSGSVPSSPLIAGAIACNSFGLVLHYAGDAQKHFVLQCRPGLIDDGFFERCRNTNYLGEFLIYLSFAMLSQHWLSFVILLGFTAFIFLPGMRQKDESLSRYPEFEGYQKRSGLFFPKLF
ncbi:MAG: DUF1295 domain-containing protein [Cyanobacteria bacterium P01_D01_bin.73]